MSSPTLRIAVQMLACEYMHRRACFHFHPMLWHETLNIAANRILFAKTIKFSLCTCRKIPLGITIIKYIHMSSTGICDAVRQKIPNHILDIPTSKAVRRQSGHMQHASFRTTRAIHTAVIRPDMKIGATFNLYIITERDRLAINKACSNSAIPGARR
jgi:hypothetical protein